MACRVQQVRQDHDTRTLQQKLQRRSLLGLLMFLLAGGALVYLLMRGPVVPEGLQSLMQAGSLADEEAKAAIADLEKDTGSMRLELSEMSDSFSEVVRLLDEVSITASAALHSEQLNELTQSDGGPGARGSAAAAEALKRFKRFRGNSSRGMSNCRRPRNSCNSRMPNFSRVSKGCRQSSTGSPKS